MAWRMSALAWAVLPACAAAKLPVAAADRRVVVGAVLLAVERIEVVDVALGAHDHDHEVIADGVVAVVLAGQLGRALGEVAAELVGRAEGDARRQGHAGALGVGDVAVVGLDPVDVAARCSRPDQRRIGRGLDCRR
jgi:hypothetical protein